MAVLRHFSIKNSPLATLKYITGETKEQKAAIVTGINCFDDPESAYIEMKMCYEHYAGRNFTGHNLFESKFPIKKRE